LFGAMRAADGDLPDSAYGRVWANARTAALTTQEAAPTQVAEWADTAAETSAPLRRSARRAPPTAGHHRTNRSDPCPTFMLVRGRFCGVWQVKDSNLRRLSRRIYRQPDDHPLWTP